MEPFSDLSRWMNIVLALIGIVGNLLVIYVILKDSKMKTVTNIHIFNLSVTDVLIMVGLLFRYPTGWPHGYLTCRLYVGLTAIADFAGSLQVVALSADRFFAVCFPIFSVEHRTVRNTYLACGLVWTLSTLLSSPIIYYSDLRAKGNCNSFWDNGSERGKRAGIAYVTIFGFIIPVALIAFFYVTILLKLKKIDKQVKQVTKFVVIIIGVYLLLWTPYWSLTFYYTYIRGNSASVNQQRDFIIARIAEYVSYSHSLVNPILYAFINKNFKESLIKLLPFEFKRREKVVDTQSDRTYKTFTTSD